MLLADCYFQVDNFDGTWVFTINPKEVWNTEGRLDDSGEEPEDLPEGFGSVSESEYEYVGSVEEGTNLLLKAGAELKQMF